MDIPKKFAKEMVEVFTFELNLPNKNNPYSSGNISYPEFMSGDMKIRFYRSRLSYISDIFTKEPIPDPKPFFNTDLVLEGLSDTFPVSYIGSAEAHYPPSLAEEGPDPYAFHKTFWSSPSLSGMYPLDEDDLGEVQIEVLHRYFYYFRPEDNFSDIFRTYNGCLSLEYIKWMYSVLRCLSNEGWQVDPNDVDKLNYFETDIIPGSFEPLTREFRSAELVASDFLRWIIKFKNRDRGHGQFYLVSKFDLFSPIRYLAEKRSTLDPNSPYKKNSPIEEDTSSVPQAFPEAISFVSPLPEPEIDMTVPIPLYLRILGKGTLW